MPITTPWRMFSELFIQYEREEPGVYELGNSNAFVIYIGSSNQIRRRLREHLNENPNACIKRITVQYRVEYTPDYQRRERQLYDDHVRLYGRPPECNEVRP